MNATQVISTGYTPRPLQARLHRSLKRFNVLVCHRRFGKTVFAINEMIDRGLRFSQTRPDLPDPRFAYLAPFRGQAKDVAWDYLKRFTQDIPGATPNEADLRIDIPRPDRSDKIRFQLLGAENPMALKGRYLDGGILDEYGEMYPSAWREAIRPTLADRKGWAIFIGTPKGRNGFHDLYQYAFSGKDPDWYCALFKASETGIIDADELASMKREMTEEEYEQELECSFQAGLVGAYFTKEIVAAEKQGKFTSVPYDPALPVNTYWDLGINDVTAVWFVQKFGREFRMVDYFEEPDLSIPELTNRMTDKIRAMRCTVGQLWLPHDAKVRDIGTGKSREETFTRLGYRPKIIPRIEDKGDSIQAARTIFPKCIFDKDRCKRGIEALMNYQRKWDSKASVFSTKPMHNWASNGADAFQQFAMAADDRDERDESDLSRYEMEAVTEYSPYS